MLNIILTPFKLIFYIVVSIKNYCYHIGIFKKNKINIPIISIGNIVFGGTGKTPMVIHLSKKLKAKGYKPAVISRGYKRKSKGLVMVHNGTQLLTNVYESGDEPYLIANKLGDVPVLVCKKREQAAKYIVNHFHNVDVIILDDGFQYRKLDRDIDIVLLNGQEHSNILREPQYSLKRSDIILTLNKQYSITEFKDGILKPTKPTESLYAFCGIANPSSFFDFIKSEDIELKWSSIFRDHYNYSEKNMQKLKSSINEAGANCIITTEKDLVKLSSDFLKQYKVYIVTVSIIFKDDTFYNQIFKSLENS